jgi:putative flippase GtrA
VTRIRANRGHGLVQAAKRLFSGAEPLRCERKGEGRMGKAQKRVPIIIPSLEPDERLLTLLKGLRELDLRDIILLNDGSGEQYDRYFEEAKTVYGCTVLKHYANMGKGRALKDAFNYCLNTFPDLSGCLTADSDGQHSPEDIRRCLDVFSQDDTQLVLGCRDFDDAQVPYKSKMGNKLTRRVCKWLCGVDVSDTQTGLRVIPKSFMVKLLNVSGERFEFETNMLIETVDQQVKMKEVSVKTLYDSKENHATHFDPVRDSIRIYRIFGRMFGKFLISALSSSVIDLLLFALFCRIFKNINIPFYAAAATVLARVISAAYNYSINYRFVFRSNSGFANSGVKYFALAAVQMCFSAGLVTGGILLLSAVPELYIKIAVDVVLFLVSYWIQRVFVFGKER